MFLHQELTVLTIHKKSVIKIKNLTPVKKVNLKMLL